MSDDGYARELSQGLMLPSDHQCSALKWPYPLTKYPKYSPLSSSELPPLARHLDGVYFKKRLQQQRPAISAGIQERVLLRVPSQEAQEPCRGLM